MAKLAKLTVLTVLAISIGLATAHDASGQQRWRRQRLLVPARAANPIPVRRESSWRLYSPYGPMQYDYSKYYGGFHARYFQEDWYPTGDRPMRGTAW